MTNETIKINYLLETISNLNSSNFLDSNITILNKNYTDLMEIDEITKAKKYLTITNSLNTSTSTSVSIKDLFKTNDEIFYQIYLKLLLNLNNRNEYLVSYISPNKTVLF